MYTPNAEKEWSDPLYQQLINMRADRDALRITLRDQFAMSALTGLVNRLSPSIENDASEAYRIADAMLKARIKEDV